MQSNTRVGYDPTRELVFIRSVMGLVLDTEYRCQTCGRAFDCCCGADCPCLIKKETERMVYVVPLE